DPIQNEATSVHHHRRARPQRVFEEYDHRCIARRRGGSGDRSERRGARAKPPSRLSAQYARDQTIDRGREQNGSRGFLGEEIHGDRKGVSKVSWLPRTGSALARYGVGEVLR